MIYEKMGYLRQEILSDKGVNCSKTEIADACSNSFTFNNLLKHFNYVVSASVRLDYREEGKERKQEHRLAPNKVREIKSS